MHFLARLFLVMLLTLGLVTPRVSAVLASALGLPRVMLCDGQGLTTLALPGDDTPTGVLEHRDCALLHALAAASAPGPQTWQPAELAVAFVTEGAAQPALRHRPLPEARAPPRNA